MNKVVVSGIAAFIAGAIGVQAASSASVPEGTASDRASAIRERIETVAKELELTQEQREKLRPIFQAEVDRLRALQADTGATRRAKLRELKAIRAEVTPKVKEVLTPEQFRKWEKMRAERRSELRSAARRRGSRW